MRENRGLLLILLTLIFAHIQCSLIGTRTSRDEMAGQNTSKHTGRLVFRVHCVREEYSLGENIFLSFSLENKSSGPFHVNKRLALNAENTPPSAREVYLNVISPSDGALPFLAFIEVGYVTKGSFALLEPGAQIYSEDEILLNQYYEIRASGKYIIEGTYENYSGVEFHYNNVWTGKVKSQPVEFEVVEKDTQ
jgi:hypothetical protein